MSDNPDHPFDSHSLKLRVTFVPDSARHQVAPSEIARDLGHDAVRIDAAIVPDGGNPPGPPFVHIGPCLFRPDTADGLGTSEPEPADYDGAAPAETRSEPPPPPTPVHRDDLGTGAAIWRRMADPAAQRRRTAESTAGSVNPTNATGHHLPSLVTAGADRAAARRRDAPTGAATRPAPARPAASDPPPDGRQNG